MMKNMTFKMGLRSIIFFMILSTILVCLLNETLGVLFIIADFSWVCIAIDEYYRQKNKKKEKDGKVYEENR